MATKEPKRRAHNSTLPAPTKAMSRAKPMPTKNAARQKKRRDVGEVYGPFFAYVKTLPCAVYGEGDPCEGPVTGHHLRSVGAGGKDAANLAPLCAKHHRLIHNIGPKRFDARFFNDLKLYGDVIYRRWRDGDATE